MPAQAPAEGRGHLYLRNVAWIWVGAFTNLFIGIFLAPYLVRKLGPDGYGVWALLFSVVSYYGFLDFGIRPAIIRYIAHYSALGEPDKINRILNTVLVYYTAGALLLLLAAIGLSGWLERIFKISPAFREDFGNLLIITAVAWLFTSNVFSACMEGLQCFAISSRIYIGCQMLRSIGTVVLLYRGFGITALGMNLLINQAIGMAAAYLGVRSVFPQLRFSFHYVDRETFRELFDYGLHSFLGNIASQILEQSGGILIGIFRNATAFGFFSLPSRMMQYAGDVICRGAAVTASNTAELAAKGRTQAVFRLGIYSNRYCFLLFAPLALFLLVYGHELIGLYVGRVFQIESAPLLPILVVPTAFAIAGQYNSSNILFGLARHQKYARALMIQAVLYVAGLIIVVPKYGILGAAWISGVLMIAVRGLYTAHLVCESLQASMAVYLREIYLKPVTIAALVGALAYAWKLVVMPGRNWPELIVSGGLIAVAFSGAALFMCVEPRHRSILLDSLRQRIPGRRLSQ